MSEVDFAYLLQAVPPSALQMCDPIVTILLIRCSVLPEAMSSDLHQLIVLACLAARERTRNATTSSCIESDDSYRDAISGIFF